MRKLKLLTLWLFLDACNLFAQEPTVREYLQGIWKKEYRSESSDFYEIYHNNDVYKTYRSNEGVELYLLYSYCIPETPIYAESEPHNETYKEKIPFDSVDFDRPFRLGSTGSETLYILYYDSTDIVQDRWLMVNKNIFRTNDDYYISPEQLDRFYMWDGGSSSGIVYYYRALSPPQYVLEAYKKIAKVKFIDIKKNSIPVFRGLGDSLIGSIEKAEEVEVFMKKDNWLRIRYYGKETIEGWIKKEDAE